MADATDVPPGLAKAHVRRQIPPMYPPFSRLPAGVAPNTADYLAFDLDDEAQAREAADDFGLKTHPIAAPGGKLFVHRKAGRSDAWIRVRGGDNTLVVGQGCAITGEVFFLGARSLAAFAPSLRELSAKLWLYNDAVFTVGDNTPVYGLEAWVSDGRKATIGGGGLVAKGVKILTSDLHSMVDLDTGEHLNPSADVEVGTTVWVGADTTLLKGTAIGAGAIIGAGSIVTGRVGSAELWAGSPARQLRRRVSWTDSFPPAPAELAAVRAAFPSPVRLAAESR